MPDDAIHVLRRLAGAVAESRHAADDQVLDPMAAERLGQAQDVERRILWRPSGADGIAALAALCVQRREELEHLVA